ncbi:MAG: methionine synthase [Bacteroidales bacterium]|nr:methionine synthase [Bacteroidales bacterium]
MDGLREALGRRILILDGAMGTMLQRHGLSGNSESFNLSHPDTILDIHRAYIDAGADIITTNTFSANRLSQAEYGCAAQAQDFARAGARLAREAAETAPRRVWVAGSLGPTGKSLTLAQDLSDPAWRAVSFDEMAQAYAEQVRGLLEGGVDILLLETCFDALNAKAALYAISGIPEAAALPLMVSVSAADRSGRTLTGQTPEAFFRSIRHARPLCFGLNCSLGAQDLAPLVADVAAWADCAVSCYPNAGLPNEMGQYDETPAQTAAALERMARGGLLNLAGGCCGTTPEHIRAIAAALRGIPPRPLPEPDRRLSVSGLESVTVDVRQNRFTNIGERTNVAGSRRFAKLIAAGDYETALQVAAGQIEGGASIIDINMDDAMLDSTAQMQAFLRWIAGDPAVARAAVMVDSSHWETLLAGLKNAQGHCIVNSISLKEGEAAFLAKAREIRRLGASVVVMAFDEQGQATTYDRKVAICARAFRLLTEQAGFDPWEIIFDVNVLSVGTGIPEHARYGVDFIEAVRWIKANLPGALTSGGISNLSFAFRGNNPVREAMHSVFLYHAIAAGLDMGIVNPGMLQVYDDIDPALLRAVEDVILDRSPDATERLIEVAQEMAARVKPDTPGNPAQPTGKREGQAGNGGICGPTPPASARERLVRALVTGGSPTLQEDLLEALAEKGRAVDVIEGPLMEGMARVGERFAAGKMFLPQVVKSAKVMRDAVEILQPYMGEEAGGAGKPRFLLATVKGDVHDIGKNITGIVLRCNGFEVTDLGVMVPKETILEQAAAIGADLVGVSGLITPSLYQMEELCREMAARGLTTPLLIGGATTSALHTAVKLAPLYGHVFYAPDASVCAVLAGRLMSDRDATEVAEHRKQEELRKLYHAGDSPAPASPSSADPATPSSTSGTSPSFAGSASSSFAGSASSSFAGLTGESPAFPADTYLRGAFFADIPCRELSIAEVLPYFDWKLFYAIWGIKPPSRLDPDHSSGDDSPEPPRSAYASGPAHRLDPGHSTEEAPLPAYATEPGTADDTIVRLSADAIDQLEALKRESGCRIRIAARFDACHATGDEIVAAPRPDRPDEPAWRLPMLRQEGPAGRSLADFVAPEEYGFDSPAGMFAISVHRSMDTDPSSALTGEVSPDTPSVAYGSDSRQAGPVYKATGHPTGCTCEACTMNYESLLERSLRLALAEAASGWLDAQLNKQLRSGTQPCDVSMSTPPVRIIKPAAGYASCPDHSLKRDILALLPDAAGLDIRLTDACAMIPDASICGLIFAHPAATYPDIRRLSPAALESYAARRGFSPEETRQFLGHLR